LWNNTTGGTATPTDSTCPSRLNRRYRRFNRSLNRRWQNRSPSRNQSEPEPEPVPEPEPEPEPEPVVAKENPCPTCDNEASFIEQYDRWYCYTCQQYLPKVEPEQQPAPEPEPEPEPEPKAMICATCGKEATFIEQYNRWYCYTDKKYI
jgi:ribosomal protein S27AE